MQHCSAFCIVCPNQIRDEVYCIDFSLLIVAAVGIKYTEYKYLNNAWTRKFQVYNCGIRELYQCTTVGLNL